MNIDFNFASSSFSFSSDHLIPPMEELPSLSRKDLRSICRETFGPIPAKISSSAVQMRALLLEAISQKDQREMPLPPLPESGGSKPSRWAIRLADILGCQVDADFTGSQTNPIEISIEMMKDAGWPASAGKFPAYWSANPAGRAAVQMGLVASLRKRGDSRILILTPVQNEAIEG